MYTHLCHHVQGSLFHYEDVSILAIDTRMPCSYKSIEFLYAPPLSVCAFFNTVFIHTHPIHINTCSCVYVYTKTVLKKKKRMDINKWICNKICSCIWLWNTTQPEGVSSQASNMPCAELQWLHQSNRLEFSFVTIQPICVCFHSKTGLDGSIPRNGQAGSWKFWW